MEEKKEASKHHEHPAHHEHEVHHEHHEKNEFKIDNNPDEMISKFNHKMKKNPWMPVSFVLGIIVIILLVVVLLLANGAGAKTVTADTAGKNVVAFAESQGLSATVINTSVSGPFYEVTLSMNGQTFPVYVTKDGKQMATSLIPLAATTNSSATNPNTNTPAADVPKLAKPVVRAFIFSYCPYGTQFEKALVPAYNLLKNKADIDIVAIGAMHGEFEHVESLRQICIEKNYGKDKLFSYLKQFNENSEIGACSGTDTCVNPLIQKIYTSLAIDKTKIETCMTKDAPALYDLQGKQASELGISGSPTFVINGVEVSVDRTPNAIKTAICNAFTTAPAECSQNLSTTALSAGFGGSAGTSTGASC
jgi:protein-disulfide isomerase